MKVEKRGNVEILRLKRKKFVPEKRRCVKSLWYKLKAFFLPRAEEIHADQLINLIIKTFGNERYHLLISDEVYRVISKEQMEELLKEDDTDQLPYIIEYADCDDSSDVLLGCLTKKTWSSGIALGQIWWFCSEFGHAQNLFCDGEKIWIVEPQTDTMMSWADLKKRYPDIKAYMIKF
ncbi:MAG: hypothetical protein ACTSVW_00385 [Candidatus Njordarchaeales archaeon]